MFCLNLLVLQHQVVPHRSSKSFCSDSSQLITTSKGADGVCVRETKMTIHDFEYWVATPLISVL
jgi:hypothetical protein